MASEDLNGRTFGHWKVVSRAPSKPKQPRWNCVCVCGTERPVLAASLKSGKSTACGCTQYAAFAERRTSHGMSEAPEYRIWQAVKDRCGNPKHRSYPRYGGRGIRVCDRWLESFDNFLADMGPRPDKSMSIDRMDNDKGYSPDNCRWATPSEQANNTSQTRMMTAGGVTLPMTEMARLYGIPHSALSQRVNKLGMSDEDAVRMPYGGNRAIWVNLESGRISLREACTRRGLNYSSVHWKVKKGMSPEQAIETSTTQGLANV